MLHRDFGSADSGEHCGLSPALFEFAKHLVQMGRTVLVLSSGKQDFFFNNGVLCLGAPNENDLAQIARSFGQIETLVCVSRVDILQWKLAYRQLLFYCDSTEVLDQPTVNVLRRKNVPVICMSELFQDVQLVDFTSDLSLHMIPDKGYVEFEEILKSLAVRHGAAPWNISCLRWQWEVLKYNARRIKQRLFYELSRIRRQELIQSKRS